MKFKGCQFEGDEYFCIVSLTSIEKLSFNHAENIKQEVNKNKGNIQIKMNVC